jgi:hypothetical protein
MIRKGVWTSENVRKARNRASKEIDREMEIEIGRATSRETVSYEV